MEQLDFTLPLSKKEGTGAYFSKNTEDSKVTESPYNRSLTTLLSPLPPYVATLIALSGQMRQELEANLAKLFSLNPGRREAIFQYLSKLSAQNTGFLNNTSDPLKSWINQLYTSAQENALRTFFEEVAIFTLGQVLLLKSWSDRGIRPMKQDDLNNLNWALSSALKPFLPVDREGWQVTRPNLYSWYNPSSAIQRDLWKAIEPWTLADESPFFLLQLLKLTRQFQPSWPEIRGYDLRFFSTFWEKIFKFGFQTEIKMGPLKRRPVAFSPTLRDSTMVLTSPKELSWIGLEQNQFQLFLSEMSQLWRGPGVPPLWTTGSGLEVFAKDQLSLTLGSPKPSLYALITEMEACDIAFVLEERCIRPQGRQNEAQEFRNQLENYPSLKKLKSTHTSMGAIQACVALSKLRPGGLLWIAREEPLAQHEGQECLNFLLEKAKLLCEWSFTDVNHTLPLTAPLFPKYLYLFQRETNIQNRLENYPLRISIEGQIRSHIEVPLLLSDAFTLEHPSPPQREHWKIHHQQSPSPQKEWSELWPERTEHDVLDALEKLRKNSVPLAYFTTIRQCIDSAPKPQGPWKFSNQNIGLFASLPYNKTENHELLVTPTNDLTPTSKGTGFFILFRESSWMYPLKYYLQSKVMEKWFDHTAERKNGRWILSEHVLKLVPIPKPIIFAMGIPLENEATTLSLPREWQNLLVETDSKAEEIKEKLLTLKTSPEKECIQASVFVEATHALEKIKQDQAKLLSLVGADGQIEWADLIELLPKPELTQATYSDQVQISGNLPLHLPIINIEKVRSPIPGILFCSETGRNVQLSSIKPRVLDILWSEVKNLVNPTWGELIKILKIPRDMELFEQTAVEILKSHGRKIKQIQNLNDLIVTCLNF
ncbi:MAG: hypothetical protein HY843_05175 [Bdellovibrio sp.]|nr:hypothetical protein [Bdellovibrio sp.]